MASHSTMLRRRFRALQRNLRGVRMVVRAFLGTDHPLLAHIIPVRRCNLACKYCNEFDDFSKPVQLETMFRRVDKLAELGTSVITISGGEPLLHPELDDIIHRIRRHGIIAGLITNGYLLTGERIERLNRAGLEWLQISIDNVTRVNSFQDNIALGRPNQWRCRAGARYLYICEDGLVHYCSQQRGYPAIPLEQYTIADIRREYLTEKACAPHCTVSCVHQVSIFDSWRAPQHPATAAVASRAGELVQIE